MIDSHCHLEHMKNVKEVVEEAQRKMKAVVTSFPDPRNMDSMVKLRKKYPHFVFLAAGFHPEHLNDFDEEQIKEYIDLIKVYSDQIVSIGEIGLDYFWIKDEEGKEKSRGIFKMFIDLALELDKPITIHGRNGEGGDAISEIIEILKNRDVKKAMFHCFSGSLENLEECLKQGWYISYATIICRSPRHQRLAKQTPLERMLLDTDAPWLDPDNKPGSKDLTNRPWKIERSAEVIAQAKGIEKKLVLEQTERNAIKFFRLDL